MDPEQIYRVEHIFRPLTAKQVEEYRQQLLHMEKQFSIEFERFKAEGPRPKPAPYPIPPHTSQRDSKPKRKKLNIKFEEPANVKVMVDSTGSTMEELF